MVTLSAARTANATTFGEKPLVAVFAGGTAGIGEYTLHAFVAAQGAAGLSPRVYLVGRNAAAADKILAECKTKCPKGTFRFVQTADLSLVKNVDAVCASISEAEQGTDSPRVDLLCMTQGGLYLGPRNDTVEGLDFSMAMHYYSRARFAFQLVPLLERGRGNVVSIYAAGLEDKLFADDLSLRDPAHYGFANVRSHVIYMKTMFFEALAQKHAGKLSLVHCFPGIVPTPAFNSPDLPWWLKVTWRVAGPLITKVATGPEECGTRVLFLASDRFPARGGKDGAKGSDGVVGGGAYETNLDGEGLSEAKMGKAFKKLDRDAFREKVWQHTNIAFEEIAQGKVFKG